MVWLKNPTDTYLYHNIISITNSNLKMLLFLEIVLSNKAKNLKITK